MNAIAKAQGSIEYLLIIAIVIVVALMVVSILLPQTNVANNTSKTQSDIYWSSQPLAISDSAFDSNGTLIVSLKNNTGDVVTVNSINVGGVVVYPDSLTLSIGASKTIYLNKQSIMGATQASITITYTNSSGVAKNLSGKNNLVSTQVPSISPPSGAAVLLQSDCFDWNPASVTHSICTCNDMNTIDYNSTTLSWTYSLANNIDFKNCSTYYTTGSGFRPIGTQSVQFSGKFLGNSHTIKNLYIYRPDTNYVGLFGYVSTNTLDINDLGMIDSNVRGSNYVGGISGMYGKINNSYNTGTVSGFNMVGGLGGGTTVVNNSYNSGTITSTHRAGGINGSSGTITNSYNLGAVSNAGDYAGGISGSGGNVNNCYNSGAISGLSEIGGISGYGTNISNSYNLGTVTSTVSTAGGISGQDGTITNCYNQGAVSGVTKIGGINGQNATVTNSYNTGTITGTGNYTGGINAYTGTMTSSYNTGAINGATHTGGINGGTGVIINSYNLGAITGTAGTTGGIAGDATSIYNSYNAGIVNGIGTYTGGLNGYGGIVYNCFNTGAISGGNYTGGITGSNGGNIINSYNTGRISGLDQVGGIEGRLNVVGGNILNSFSTGSVSGTSNVYGTLGQTLTASIKNVYWYDSNTSDNATTCYHTGDSNCTKLTDTNFTLLYNSSTDLYDTNLPVWNDGNWVWSGTAYPTLSWQ